MAMSNSSTAQVLPFEAEMPPEGAAQSPRGREISRREQIWQYVEDSTIIGGFIFLVIVFSTVCFVLETEPALKGPELQGMWFGYASMISRRRQHRIIERATTCMASHASAQKLLWSLLGCILTCSRFPVSSSSFETFAVVIFSVEYMIRLICCPDRRTFVIAPLNLVDLLAIVPCACHIPSPVTTPISPVLGSAWPTPAQLGSAWLVPSHLLRSRRSTGLFLRSCRRRL